MHTSQDQNVMAFVAAYPGVILLIMGIMLALIFILAREDLRRLWAVVRGEVPPERRKGIELSEKVYHSLHESIISLDKTVTSLSSTLTAVERSVEKSSESFEKITTELFSRVRAVEDKCTYRDSVCDTLGQICPHRNGTTSP